MVTHQHTSHTHKEPGVSNVEIDWFLRGKLPEATTPMPIPKKHVPTPPPQEEQTIHEILKNKSPTPAEAKLGHVLSRSRSFSALETRTEVEKKKIGFFRSLFGKKKDKASANGSMESVLSRSSSPEPMVQRTTSNGNKLKKSVTSASTSDLDPRLEEFLRYYKAKGLDKLQKDTSHEKKEQPALPKKNEGRVSFHINESEVSSISSSTAESKASPQKQKLDKLGRPIPPHPAKAPLPPAIIKKPHFETTTNEPGVNSSAATSTSRLTGFLKRHHNSVSENSLSRATSLTSSTSAQHQSIPDKDDSASPVVIPGLEDLPKLKRVSFAVPVFFNDPPQQIPSRTPRKGEVEILKDGSIVIHKLSAVEKRHLMSQGGGGIVVGGSGHLKVITKPSGSPSSEPDEPAKPVEPVEPETTAEHEAQHHSIKVAAAAAAAEARGKEGGSDLKRTPTNSEDDVTVSDGASKISIDKPMVRHNKSAVSLMTMSDENEVFPPPNVKVPLDVLYTRCCHLREILPIPATLKQLKPGSTDPVSVLQLRNPKPSLVEVLTFSDFISIAPVLCVSLDGVSLSSEMFRIILSALVAKQELEKLTLRNTPLDEMGWKLLCWFLTKNRTMSRLDLTQVPSLHIGVQKPAKPTAVTSSINRMECDMSSRSDMNWNLMTAALAARGGIDEFVMNGAKITDEEFKNLFELAIVLKTTKLGLAYNDLSSSQIEVIASITGKTNLIGLDMGYNDLGDKLDPLLEAVQRDSLRDTPIQFLSFNSCNLYNNRRIIETLFSEFAVFKELKYIDLSNNKRMFPSAIISLTECLPIYPKLARIHLDYNDLTQRSVVAFAELIPLCKSLRYVSLVGNKIDSVSAGALVNAMKLSKTVLTLDIDYEDIAPKFRESIGLYTVRNMQHSLYNDDNKIKQGNDRNMAGLREQLAQLLIKDEGGHDPTMVEGFVEKAMNVRKRIHESIEELFRLRLRNELNVEGKEALIRLCFVDASIEKGLNLLSKRIGLRDLHKKYEAYQQSEVTDAHDKLLPPSSTVSPVSMSRQSSTSLVNSSYLDSTTHTVLMPFSVANAVHSTADDDDDDQLEVMTLDDRESARSVDNSKIKEEASALKIGGMIRDSGISRTLCQEHLDQIQDMSGEQLKELLLETDDYRNIAGVLEKFKERGIGIADIYKKSETHSNQGTLDLETLKNTANNVTGRNTIVSDDDDSSDTHDSGSIESEDHNVELGHAYDEILDHLERVRTNQ